MKVSFGQIISISETRSKTSKQSAIEDVATGILHTSALDTYLRHKLKADILITSKKDGNTQIAIVAADKKSLASIPQLNINNKRFLMNIYTQVEDYGKLCKEIAENL